MREHYLLDGRYEILEPLGEGGMANVYLAHDLFLDRDVSVKLLRLDLRDDPHTVHRFQREAMAATELVNPNIVSVYDFGEDKGMQYLVMEYVKGTDLKTYIKDHFPIPYQAVLDIMAQILSAVEAAHEHQIIHRDLKPQNILIDENGRAKITDFGIAIALSENAQTQTNTVLGSVHYLSPEQARGSMATKQSDIYSLGIILYELLTGSVPFEGENAVSIAIKHSQEQIPFVRDFDPRIPQALENVVLRATSKEASDRYDTVAAMALDLKTSLSPVRAGETRLSLSDINTDDATKVMPIVSPSDLKPVSADEEIPAKPVSRETQPELPKKKYHRRRALWVWLGIGLLLLLGIWIFAFASGRTVTVPDLAGETQTEATTTLREQHLKLGSVKRESSETIKSGRIISSDPSKQTTVQRNSAVDVIVSSGSKLFTFGNYVGKQYEVVQASLKARGFTVVRHSVSSPSTPANQIMDQDIAAGKKVTPGDTTVTFTVSSGSKSIRLDDLTGMTRAEVQKYGADNELNIVFSNDYSDDVAKDKVMKQSPSADTTVHQGDRIRVTISLGEKPDDLDHFNANIAIPFQAPDSDDDDDSDSSASQENLIQVYVRDNDHGYSKLYRQMTIRKDTNISIPMSVQSGKTGGYKIVRDGKTILSDDNLTKKSH